MKKEELNIQNSTEGATMEHSSTELLINRQIPKTPFHYVKAEDKKGFLAVGRYKITEEIFEEVSEALDYIDDNQWELIAKLVGIITDEILKEK